MNMYYIYMAIFVKIVGPVFEIVDTNKHTNKQHYSIVQWVSKCLLDTASINQCKKKSFQSCIKYAF